MNTGDLIFTQIGSDDNIISAVTEGYGGARPDHMGVILKTDLGVFVLEAYPPEVRLTHIDVFLRRTTYQNNTNSEPRYMLGRINSSLQSLIPRAMEYGLSQREIPYDQLYLPDTKQLYCSELVVDMFKHANEGKEVFSEAPMSFRDLDTGLIHSHWVSYYKYFGLKVPDGEPGSNPGEISLDDQVNIYKVHGPIFGYRGT